ncbi:hypothetical protein [Caulobacter segnis]|uniref:Uncharacterized protein n=1 Tax=Caulobacter segnis TaxID=88688 RepID=A0A2W5V5D6_9CAUL|nr:hypothetical protein [Caulobacter segnis]PZR35040.1 MAG: hypothetical protein DI526_08170 [Caulobacter segnis]
MRDWKPGSPFRQRLGVLALLITWAAIAAWCWLRFHDGAMTHQRFVMAQAGVAFQFVPAIGYALWRSRTLHAQRHRQFLARQSWIDLT